MKSDSPNLPNSQSSSSTAVPTSQSRKLEANSCHAVGSAQRSPSSSNSRSTSRRSKRTRRKRSCSSRSSRSRSNRRRSPVDSRMGQKLWPATYPQGRSFVGDVVGEKKKGGAEGSAAEKFWQDPDVKKIYPVLLPSNKMASKTTARELRRLNRTLERGVRIVASRQQQAPGPAH